MREHGPFKSEIKCGSDPRSSLVKPTPIRPGVDGDAGTGRVSSFSDFRESVPNTHESRQVVAGQPRSFRPDKEIATSWPSQVTIESLTDDPRAWARTPGASW